MQEGVNDKIKNKMIDLHGKVVQKISSICKGVQPFAADPVSDREKSELLNKLSRKQVYDLYMEFGEKELNQFIGDAKLYEMNKRKREVQQWLQ